MESFSYSRPAPPVPPPTKWQWGGPKPEGYAWPPASSQPGAFLICDVCGSAVSPGSTDRHDAWHAERA